MNSKTKAVAGAGAGLLALSMIGGGTFAAWSDFQTLEDNNVGADHLTLQLDANNQDGVAEFNNLTLAPGENRETNYYVASRDGAAVPNASLTLTLQDLVGTEDGCQGNTEAPDQLSMYSSSCAHGTPSFDSAGQFIQEAQFWVRSSDPVPMADSCTTMIGRTAGLPGSNSGVFKIDAAEDQVINLLSSGVTIGPDEKICVNVQISLPHVPNAATYNNSAQGDSAAFDLRFDLKQV